MIPNQVIRKPVQRIESGSTRPSHPGFSLRAAFWTFIGIELLCLALYVWIGRNGWFFTDEWNYLAQRTAGNPGDLFRPANEHWSTLPILAFRLLWQLVGIRSYLPYLTLIVLLHLTTAALLRAVMRRSGVSPWIATVVALVFTLFGAGYDNIEWPIQIGYCGSLVFGLAYLLMTDHDGPFQRRDVIGMVFGLASLMSSGIGVTMVIVVVMAVQLRRGVRVAVATVTPLAIIYLVWLIAIGHQGLTRHAGLREIVNFVVGNSYATFAAIGHLPGIGLVLVIVLLSGGLLIWPRLQVADQRQQLAAPVALLAGSLVFLVITGIGRGSPASGIVGMAGFPSRYLHVEAALMLPAFALAADAIIQRWRLLTPVILAALVVGVPGNFIVLVNHTDQTNSQAEAYRKFILTLPRLPVARRLPPSTHPDSLYDPWLTIGWLRAGVSSGRIPSPGPVPATDTASWTLLIALQPARQHANGSCASLRLPVTVHLVPGSTITTDATVGITYIPNRGPRSAAVPFGSPLRQHTYLLYQGMTVRMRRSIVGQTLTVCHPAETPSA